MARLVVLLLALVAVATAYKKQGFCYSKSRGKSYAPGAKWTEPGCVQATCINGRPAAVACPAVFKPGCKQVKGDSKADYPGCCPKLECPKPCFSKALKKVFKHGAMWTEPGCVKATCKDGVTAAVACPLSKPRPGCKLVKGDSKAAYPGCCPKIKCYKPCVSKALKKVFKHGAMWTEPGCVKATCKDGVTAAVACPAFKVKPGCVKVKGDSKADYPGCCPKIKCYKPCFSKILNKVFKHGEKLTEPGCIEASCSDGKIGRLPCPLIKPGPGCLPQKGKPGADYPKCCLSFKCPLPGQCTSYKLQKFYDDGAKWTEPKCTQFRCIKGKSVPKYCPPIKRPSPKSGCKIVAGKPGSDFPSCCPKLVCKLRRPCFSKTKLKYFKHGQSWMEGKCMEARCYNGRISLKNKCVTSCKGKKKC